MILLCQKQEHIAFTRQLHIQMHKWLPGTVFAREPYPVELAQTMVFPPPAMPRSFTKSAPMTAQPARAAIVGSIGRALRGLRPRTRRQQ